MIPHPYTGKNLGEGRAVGPYEASIRASALARRARLSPSVVHLPAPRRVVRTIVVRPPALVVVVQAAPKPPAHVYRPIVKSISYIVEVDGPFQWRHIVDQVCAKHNVSFEQLCSRIRTAPVVAARFEACYRLSNETPMSLMQIGRRLGGKDHTTVLYGVRQHAERIAAEAAG